MKITLEVSTLTEQSSMEFNPVDDSDIIHALSKILHYSAVMYPSLKDYTLVYNKPLDNPLVYKSLDALMDRTDINQMKGHL